MNKDDWIRQLEAALEPITDRPLTVEEWVAVRLANCHRILKLEDIPSRDGWLEDAAYYQQILDRLAGPDEPQS